MAKYRSGSLSVSLQSPTLSVLFPSSETGLTVSLTSCFLSWLVCVSSSAAFKSCSCSVVSNPLCSGRVGECSSSVESSD